MYNFLRKVFSAGILVKMVLHTKLFYSLTIVLLLMRNDFVSAMDGCLYPKTEYNDRENLTGKPWPGMWRCGDTCM